MRVGCCASLADAAILKAAGFDFIEVGVQNVLKGHEDDATWSAGASDPDTLVLPMEAANGLVPPSLPILGPDRDLTALKTYMQRVGERAARLGIQRLVFGSGGARKRPEDMTPDQAMDQLVEFCRIAGDAVAPHGVMITIEHLNRRETNTINNLAEELELIERTDHPAVQALVDSYHYGVENDSDQALVALGDRLRHVHVAEPVGRVQPGGNGPISQAEGEQAFDFESFFCLLRKIGYRERISFEGKWTAPVETVGRQTVDLIRRWWERAGRCEA